MMKFKKLTVSDSFYKILSLISVAVYMIIAMQIPLTISPRAIHDDGLFLKLSKNILLGQWLGDYNNLTLAKGAGFPLVLAINAILGIPITLFLGIFYAATCYFITTFFISQKMPRFIAFSMFILILFHPAMFPFRIIRDNFYSALTLISFFGVAYIIFENKKLKNSYVFFSGLMVGLFLITREEWVWIIPAVLTLILIGIYYQRKEKQTLNPIFMKLSLILFIGFLIVNIISIINFNSYGIFKDVDFKEKEFQSAVKNLNSIQITHETPFVPVPSERREILYKISPTFAELREYFEVTGKGWTEHGCKVYPDTCGEYAGGWFVWALRDAVASKGYYKNAAEASKFYKKMNEEITSACDDKKIVCKKNLIPFMPNINSEQWLNFPKKFYRAINMAAGNYGYNLPTPPSDDAYGSLFSFKILLGNPKTTPTYDEEKISGVSGWFYSPKHNWFFLNCDGSDGKKIITPKRLKSPDIANFFNDPNADNQRFSFSIPNEDCFITFEAKKSINSLNLKNLSKAKNFSIKIQDEILYIDNYFAFDQQQIFKFPYSVLKSLYRFYKNTIPFIFIIGFAFFFISALSIIFKKHTLNPLWILAASLWILVISRLFLLVLIDISSFPTLIDFVYLLPIFPILIIASFLSISDMYNYIKSKKLFN